MPLLKKRDKPPEIPLPTDYQPVDYTSMAPVDEQPRSSGKIIGAIVGALVLLGIVAVLIIMGGGEDEVTATPAPKYQLSVSKAELVSSGDGLEADITVRGQGIPAGTQLQAALLEDGQPFPLWEDEAGVAEVEGNTTNVQIPIEFVPIPGEDGRLYEVLITADVAGQAITATKELEILSSARAAFFEPAEEPTVEPTEVVVEPTTEPATPEPPPGTPGPVDALAQADGQLYLSPYGPSGDRGAVAAGEPMRVVAKLWNQDWYLVATSASSGWVRGTMLDLGNANIPLTGEDGAAAAVFNGGNVRAVPGGAVVTVVDAGDTVALIGRDAASTVFQIRTQDGVEGWVVANLLTINPAVISSVPIQ